MFLNKWFGAHSFVECYSAEYFRIIRKSDHVANNYLRWIFFFRTNNKLLANSRIDENLQALTYVCDDSSMKCIKLPALAVMKIACSSNLLHRIVAQRVFLNLLQFTRSWTESSWKWHFHVHDHILLSALRVNPKSTTTTDSCKMIHFVILWTMCVLRLIIITQWKDGS